MTTWEIITHNGEGQEKQVHVIELDGAHAMIKFREEYSIDDWTVKSLKELTESRVIEHP